MRIERRKGGICGCMLITAIPGSLVNISWQGDQDRPRMDIPQGWPNADVREILRLARASTPIWFFVDNGTQAWQRYWESENKRYEGLGQMSKVKHQGVIHYMRADRGLPGQIWHDTNALDLYRAGATAELIRDDNRPGLVGLKVNTTYMDTEARIQRLYWIDPLRG